MPRLGLDRITGGIRDKWLSCPVKYFEYYWNAPGFKLLDEIGLFLRMERK